MNISSKKRNDILLVTFILVAGIVLTLLIYRTKGMGNYVTVKVDGKIVCEKLLNEDLILEIEGYQGGKNIVRIKDGAAYVENADCPDELCVKTGKVSHKGETIVCLPHRVVVEIDNKTVHDEDFDSIVK